MAHGSKLSSPERVPGKSRAGRQFTEKVLLEISKEESEGERFGGSCRTPALSPQDCVQLNQYKLKDEIGKVNIGRVWGGTGGFGAGGHWAHFCCRAGEAAISAAGHGSSAGDTGLFWVVLIKLYFFF